jgi:serine/threonine protein kinase/WD40 repeat protein
VSRLLDNRSIGDPSSDDGSTVPTDVDGASSPVSPGLVVPHHEVPPVRPLIGRVLGRFRVVEQVGAGGLGEVYRAEQELLGRDAVIKIMRRDRPVTPQRAERFLREARLAARLDHPYAAHVYAFGAEPDGLLWIAMELVRGQTLRDLVRQRGPMPPALFAPLAVALCEVVHAAHELGIVHRDLKPANVMAVASGGHLLPKLLDFGVAKAIDEVDLPADADAASPDAPVRAATSRLTRDDQLLGSPPYMAPEQWTAPGAVDRRADVYALGALFYYVLTGRPPFRGNSPDELARARVETAPEPVGDAAGAIDAVLVRALAQEPGDRFATALELGDALAAAASATAAPPALDARLVDDWTTRGPEPLAELVFALSSARTPSEADAVARSLVDALARWLAVLALAETRQRREVPPERARQLGRALLARGLTPEGWLELAHVLAAGAARPRAITGSGEAIAVHAVERPITGSAAAARERTPISDSWPHAQIPSLEDAVGPLGEFFAGAGAIALAELVAPREALPPGPALHARLASDLARLRVVLGEMSGMLDGALVADVDGQPIKLCGLGRRQPAALWGPPLAPGEVALIAVGGAARLTLSPLVELASALPGGEPEVFVLAAGARGPCLRALPSGAEIAGIDAARRVAEALELSTDESDAGARDEEAPYLGLAPFAAGDADRFVGRAREAETFINLLRARRVVGLVGASGAGKSSFLHAGVLAALPEGWSAVSLRPGAAPLRSLLAALEIEMPGSAAPAAVADALIARAPRAGALVIAVDQMEELFALGAAAEERERFAAALVAAADGAGGRVRVVLCLRDDFLARAEALGPLRGRLASALSVLVTPRPAELRRIIVEPAARAGYRFEDEAVVDEIVGAIADRPGGLALLSFAALAWWGRRDRQRRILPTDAYRQLGGVVGALATHAEALYAGMPARARQAGREVIRNLVTAEGTRAALPTADLVKLAGPGGDEALEALVAGRLLVARDDVDGDAVELAHEALIDAWPLLRRIREEDAADAGLRDDLRGAARGWSQRQRRDDELWRGRALAELERFRARADVRLTRLEEEFADASRALGLRTRRRRRALVIGAIGAAAAAAFALGLAERAARRSEARARDLAEQARRGEAEAQVRLARAWADEGEREGARGSSLRALAYLGPAYGTVDGPGIRYAMARAVASIDERRAILRGHRSPVSYLEWSRDGRFIGTADEEAATRLWRFERGRVEPAGELPEKSGVIVGFAAGGELFGLGDEKGVSIRSVSSLAQTSHIGVPPGIEAQIGGHFTHDGRTVLVWRTDGFLGLYDPSGALLRHIDTPLETTYLATDFSSERLAFTTTKGGLFLWETATPRYRPLLAPGVEIGNVDMDPGGVAITATGFDRTYVFDGATGRQRHVLDAHRGRHLAAISRDARWIATGGADRAVKLWDARTGRMIAVLAEHRGPVNDLAFDPSAQLLATGAGDGAVRIFNTRGAMLAVYEGHAADALELAWSPDGQWLASSGADGQVSIWPGRTPQVRELVAAGGELDDLAVCGDLAVLARDKELVLVDLAAGRIGRRIPLAEEYFSMACSAAAGRLAIGLLKGARLYRLDGEAAGEIKGLEGPIVELAFSRDGRTLATESPEGDIRAWSADRGAPIRRIAAPDPTSAVHPSAMTFSHDGASLLVADSSGHVSAWSTAGAGRLARVRLHQTEITSLEISPDGSRIATASSDRSLSIARARDLAIERTIEQHAAYIESVAWSPDSGLLVTGSADSMAYVWEAATGSLVGELRPGHGPVASARFAGDRIVAATYAGRVMSFPASLEERSPDAIRELLGCRLPFRLGGGGRIERASPGEGCADASAGSATRTGRPPRSDASAGSATRTGQSSR